jgi:hypothetical protein
VPVLILTIQESVAFVLGPFGRSTMEHVWHTIEWLFNTVLFQLAGLIIGQAVAQVDYTSTTTSTECQGRAW